MKVASFITQLSMEFNYIAQNHMRYYVMSYPPWICALQALCVKSVNILLQYACGGSGLGFYCINGYFCITPHFIGLCEG